MSSMSESSTSTRHRPDEPRSPGDDPSAQERRERSHGCPGGEGRESEWSPVADIHETDAELTFTVELPGIAPDRVRVTVENDVLTIDGERSAAHLARRDGSYRLRERHNGPMVARFRLPPGVDPSRIRSEYADGVIDVHVPMPTRSRSTVIPVAVAAPVAG